MRNQNLFTVLLSIFLIVTVSFGNVSTALADDASPGETPETTSTEEPVEPPVIETPAVSTPEPVMQEQTAGTEVPISSDAAVESTPSEPEGGLLTQVPSETELVVLDENGDVVPLVTQDALDIILDTDPMWCPANTLPGGPNCSINFPDIKALLKDMQKFTGNYDEDGIIYFTSSAGAFDLTSTGNLGADGFEALKEFDLILQGGWNGQSGASADFSGQTSFGASALTIGASGNPWVGSITLRDFLFSAVNSTNAVTIYTTTGDITLDNVDVTQQTGNFYAAYLDSDSGNITVQNGSSFDGNNTGTRQSQGFKAETGGTITIDGSSATPITFTDSRGTSTNYNGLTLSAPTVTLNYVTANNNDLNGIQISNASLVTLNNVIANANGTDDTALPDSQDAGSGVLVNGTGSTIVNLIGGSFNNNERYGVEVVNGAINFVSWPSCSGNDLGCVIDTNPPALNLPTTVTVEATSAAGAVATFSVSATDTLDGAVAISCSHSSGSMFPLGTTTVTCSSADAQNNVASGSFTVSIVDTTPPTIQPHADIQLGNKSGSGLNVSYLAPDTSDIVDGMGIATCAPVSGSHFPKGINVVTCTATDAHGNSAYSTFLIRLNDVSLLAATSSGQNAAAGAVTPGKVFDLDCDTVLNVFGIVVNFHNLCGYQAIITRVEANTLPGELGSGLRFGNGLNIVLMLNGQVVQDLPAGAGIDVSFPISAGPGQFTGLLWDEASGDWKNAPQASPQAASSFYEVQTKEYTGTIVIASK